ncbi:MAG: succinylglutamate desuccinylase/aspartoacylase family protein [Rickettsiaceae bacterium]|nr:succinylglutamate desuccinylase/aspartoacylase family protein [Rickettsiaceae bacterium]MDP5082977.1 succinylglutamate desuccinylase/aspartoacylase family protein [Rickettsiaceae bacterium]
MANKKIQICDAIIHPGEIANLAMPMPEQYRCSPLYMPIKIIHGKKEGPCLVVFSGLKGTELNGIEITNRLIDSLDASQISGTIIAIPVVNVYALTHYPSALPSGGDLAKCFPGNEDGSYGERIAFLFTNEILKKANYCIELQTGGMNHNILPQVYCNFDNPQTKELAKVFQSPVVTNVSLVGNHLRQTTEDLQVPLLVYEAGEAMRFDENAIGLGVDGIKNVMCAINMLSKEHTTEVMPIFSREEDWIVSHKGGILHTTVSLGQVIEKNTVLGTISDPFGSDIIESIKSVQKGVIVGINTSPLIHEGLPIFKIASFVDNEKAENVIEEWNKNQQDSEIG